MLIRFYCRMYQAILRIASRALGWRKPILVSGAGSVKKVAELIREKGISRVLLVTDKGLTSIHLPDGLIESLKSEGISCFVYDGTQPNPTFENIEQAEKLYSENNCQAFVAFGGGSPMDCAKAAAARIVRPNKPLKSMRGLFKVGKKLPPFFAVPTTAGTGSETTIAAVVTDSTTHEKYAINDLHLIPHYAVLDPELTLGLPPHITSTTGMDALTHAVEAYIGKSNTNETQQKALAAVKIVFENLEKVYNDGSDLNGREQMLLASHYAGIAFTRAYVGYVHAIAHNLGGMYGIAHGLANAIILPYVLEYYGKSAHKRLAELADCAGISEQGQTPEQKAIAFINEIKAKNTRMGIPSGFTEIKQEDIPTIARRAMKEGNPLYPVPKIMTVSECQEIIKALMA